MKDPRSQELLRQVGESSPDVPAHGGLADKFSRAIQLELEASKTTVEPPAITGSQTLDEIETVIAEVGLTLERVLAETALTAFRERADARQRSTRTTLDFLIADRREAHELVFTREFTEGWTLDPELVLEAVLAANRKIELIHDLAMANNADVFQLLGLRNLSGFVGETFASEFRNIEQDRLAPNPNQDGYPDPIALTPDGLRYIQERERLGQMTSKEWWSPYPFGGIEVKATCGNTPPASRVPKPSIGESRLPILTSAEWRSHHRDTNYLLGIYWDFVDGLPTVLAVFFRNDLERADWGNVVQPREGGGNTTSVSVMKRDGVKKMGQGWIVLPASPDLREALTKPTVFSVSVLDVAQVSSAFNS